MNFEGRWLTRNGTLVAVHKSNDLHREIIEIVYWGHELVVLDDRNSGKQQPFEYDNSKFRKGDMQFSWDEKGDCDGIAGGDLNRKFFDLIQRVNPQSGESDGYVSGCEECKR